jgi:tetratricopeptide (TPR) repeat protein
MRVPPSLAAPLRNLGLALGLALALAACDTAEERAEEHYQRGVQLLADGEVDRALVEFRNVFRLNGDHTAARLAYAGVLRERGEVREAYGQYLRLVEQDPDSLEGRKEVAQLALSLGNLPDATTHANAAYRLSPADPDVRALKATVDYATDTDRPAAVEMAKAVLAEAPANVAAHMVVIADRVNAGEFPAALPLVETALAQAPADEGLNLVKLGILENLGDQEAVGVQLAEMVRLYPDRPAFSDALIRWHMSRNDTAGAERVLRAQAERTPDDPEPSLRLVQFLLETNGAEAARAELDRLAAAAANPVPFQRARAAIDIGDGRQAEGIAALRGLIDAAEPSDDRRDTQVMLARVLGTTGDAAGRDALVDAVLAENPRHVEALKLRARREIDADKPELAVQAMRTALEQAPRDAAALTLMAEAHEREGAHELAGDRLALAVEVSGKAPAESLRYARFLMQDERLDTAESVIVDALKLDRENRDLLLALGQIHLARRDWTRADQVADILRGLDDPEATAKAAALAATALRGQNRVDETVAMLRGMLAADGENIQTLAALMQTYVESGNLAAARDLLADELARDPRSQPLRMMQAGVDLVAGDPAAAEAGYRAVLADAPQNGDAWHALYAVLRMQDRPDEATAALDQGIAASDDPRLRFTKASELELRGDFEGAIAVYEALYARDSSADLVANNLASLLTTHRSDAESLERAFTIARRLRSSDVPAFQDTYGWILTRRGDPEQALDFLEPAARGMPDAMLVQFHLGMTYAALERWDEARAALERAVAVAGPDGDAAHLAEARRQLDVIAARPEAAAGQ